MIEGIAGGAFSAMFIIADTLIITTSYCTTNMSASKSTRSLGSALPFQTIPIHRKYEVKYTSGKRIWVVNALHHYVIKCGTCWMRYPHQK